MADLNDIQRKRFSEALVRLDGDEETLVMLAEIVSEDAPVMLAKLHSEVQSGQFREVAQTGHALKGLLSTFETSKPVSDLQPLIDAARAGDSDEVHTIFTGVGTELEGLVSEISKLR